MSYYIVPEISTTTYTLPELSTTVYTLPVVTTTYYEVAVISVLRTWKALGDAPAKTWTKLKELDLTTWKKLGKAYLLHQARHVISYYPVNKPTTTYYEVS